MFFLATIAMMAGLFATAPAQVNTMQTTSGTKQALIRAIKEEVKTNNLSRRRDVCLGIASAIGIDERELISATKPDGIYLHPRSWCNTHLRGIEVEVLSPIKASSDGSFEITIQLGDLQPLHEGSDFANLMHRGTYRIEIEDGGRAKLTGYQRTCCPEQPASGSR
jgi:hypothetical protein